MSAEHGPYSLLNADDSVLVIIDVQDAFLEKLPAEEANRLLGKICWIIKLARWRNIPMLVTAEELPQQPLASKVVEALPSQIEVFNKLTFGLAQQADILEAIERTRRKTAVLIGLETDVCVMHSAIGLLELGYRVAVVADATGAPLPGQELGLARMQSGGVIITNLKGLFYEWLRTVEAVDRFHRELPEMRALAQEVL